MANRARFTWAYSAALLLKRSRGASNDSRNHALITTESKHGSRDSSPSIRINLKPVFAYWRGCDDNNLGNGTAC